MNKFPTPPPDRRLVKKSSTFQNEDDIFSQKSGNINNIENTNTNPDHKLNRVSSMNGLHPQLSKNFSKNNLQGGSTIQMNLPTYVFSEGNDNREPEYEKYNNINMHKIKQIEDMRNSILNYKLLNDKKMFLSGPSIKSLKINKSNIILFGPSGSGKSSFIKTIYKALYGTPYLPPEAVNKLIIKNKDENEGTLCFTRLHLKEETNQTSGIILCDTRGHILMNNEEKEQFRVIMEGRVKEGYQVMQDKKRNPFLLWEFWKKDVELFPKEIFYSQESGIEAIPHSVVLVFDGSMDDIIDINDEKFYKDLVEITYKKGIISI
jgi:hypothetical protein